jgi:hypothetical protein
LTFLTSGEAKSLAGDGAALGCGTRIGIGSGSYARANEMVILTGHKPARRGVNPLLVRFSHSHVRLTAETREQTATKAVNR